MGLSPEETEEWWNEIEACCEPEDIKWGGPPSSRKQLPIPDAYTDASNAESHYKRMQLMGKLKKASSVEEIEKAAASFSEHHASFKDSMFKKTGGSLIASFAKNGITTFGTSNGSGRFTDNQNKEDVVPKFGENVELGVEKEKRRRSTRSRTKGRPCKRRSTPYTTT